MKQVRRDRDRWQPPEPLLAAAVFECRRCHAGLTPLLQLLTCATALSLKEGIPLVPAGHYWPVVTGRDFTGCFAIAPADLVGGGYHPDGQRLIGCCGPSGHGGPNRVCGCGAEVGTEQADCMWPHAVYLDPARVVAVAPDAGPGLCEAGYGR